MAVLNSTILDRIWLSGTNDYQQRIPQTTQGDIAATQAALFAPENLPLYNQFVDALVNRIGSTYVHQQDWRNPLAVFKKDMLRYGDKAQEIAVKWIRSHSYSDDREDVFKMYRPDADVWFHTVNRREFYPITVNRDELEFAFTEEYGLNSFVAGIMQAPQNSDEYDEYRIMLELLAYYESNFGFFKHQLSAAPSNQATAQEFLTQLRSYAGMLRFPSSRYNSGLIKDVPVFANPSELVVLMTPQTNAVIDVYALAAAFNMEKEDIQQRIVIVDEFPIANAVALLTTEDFFQCRDKLRQNTSQYNPLTLGTNYFLHHWGMYSVSPFVPAILFTTASGSNIDTITMTPSGISISAAADTVEAGGSVKLTTNLTGTVSSDGTPIEVLPDAATYAVSVMRPVTGQAGVYKLDITGTWAQNDTLVINGTTVTVGATHTAAAIVDAIVSAMSSDADYTVTDGGNYATLTEKSGKYGIGAPSVTKTSTAGTYTLTTTTPGIPTTQNIISVRTWVDEYGVLHAGEDLVANDVITIVAKSVYLNPSGSTSSYTDSTTVTVS